MFAMDFKENALRRLNIDESRIIVFPPDTDLCLSGITKGIIFVWATWSGSAQLAIKALGKALQILPNQNDIQVYVIDGDTETAERFMNKVNETPEGGGETFWIRNGEVIAQMKKYTDKDLDMLKDVTANLFVAH